MEIDNAFGSDADQPARATDKSVRQATIKVPTLNWLYKRVGSPSLVLVSLML